jgi:hypothetical protein
MFRFALTILLSAFLLFQVQPLIARFILPWFGGSPAVWTTCMLFFQMLLLLGYLYAYLISTQLTVGRQALLHLGLLAISLVLLPIVPGVQWKPTGDENPTARILLLLSASVGAPYFLLSTTGPLLQRWFSLLMPAESPYRLYALSNVGSLLALQSYPLLFEPFLRLGTQAIAWSCGYALFAVLCGYCAWHLYRATLPNELPASLVEQPSPRVDQPAAKKRRSKNAEKKPQPASDRLRAIEPPRRLDMLVWLLLSALPSVLLLSTTNQLSQEVAVVPFLWVLPLSLYLITFIVAFDNPRWYKRPLWFGLMFCSVLMVITFLAQGVMAPFQFQIVAYSGLLLGCAMCCHGELAASRPDVRYLTLYYLILSLGGALGGLFVVVVAPLIFSQYWEFHFSVMGCIICAFMAYGRAPQARSSWQFWILLSVGLIVVVIFGNFGAQLVSERMSDNTLIAQVRNFYGVLSVRSEEMPGYGERYLLIHGQIAHGSQFRDADKRKLHTSYYSAESGVGKAIELHPRRAAGEKLRIGVVGLGIGTLASYGQRGDVVRFYELNPDVERIAREYFTYLSDSPAQVEIALGDARIQLERELATGGSQQFDILVIDAFSSDSIPMHLLTRECMALYWQHLKPDGILALHISSHFMDLHPVVRTLAEDAGYEPLLMHWEKPEENPHPAYSTSDWILITRNEAFLADLEVQSHKTPWPESSAVPILWTDDYGSLLQVLK